MIIGNKTYSFADPQEEERKRRMAYGREQGLDDATIQKYELIAKVQQRQEQAKQAQAAPTTQTKPQGRFKANSAAGFGLSLLPFGEVLRKKMNGEKITGGDVALEGALTALPVAGKVVKSVVKAAKGGRAASVAGKTATADKGIVKTLIKGNPEEGVIAGNLTKSGEALKAQARGVVPGVKPQGAAEKLLPSQADEINKTLNTVERKKTIFGRTKYGAKGSANKQLRTVETAQTKALADMDGILKTKNQPITSKDTSEIISGMRLERKDILGLKPEHLKEATELERRILSSKDVQALEKLRRGADKRINFARNPNSPDPALEEVYLSLRRNIDKKSTQLIPDLKTAKTNFGKLESAKDTLVQSSPATMRQFAGQGPTARLMGGSVAQNLTDKAGRVLTRAGKIQAAPITKQAQVRLPFSAASAFGASQPASTELPADASELFPGTEDPDEMLGNELNKSGITDPEKMFDALSGQGDYAPAQDPAAPEAAPEQMIPSSADLFKQAFDLRLAGDVKGSKDILEFAKVAATFEKETNAKNAPNAKGKPLSADTKKMVENARNGLKAIDTLSGIIQDDRGKLTKTVIPGRGLAGGLGNRLLGTGKLETARKEISDVITRLRTGAAINNQELAFYSSQMPQASDDEETVNYKLDIFKQLFTRLSGPTYYDDGSGGTGLEDISQLFNQEQGQ